MATQETQIKIAKPLLVFSDDWGRHPSSCQHLIHHLLGDYSVTWVNTIGMRPPRFDLLTVKRGLEKLNGWIKPKDESSYQKNQTMMLEESIIKGAVYSPTDDLLKSNIESIRSHRT